jgi:hypothetical protein
LSIKKLTFHREQWDALLGRGPERVVLLTKERGLIRAPRATLGQPRQLERVSDMLAAARHASVEEQHYTQMPKKFHLNYKKVCDKSNYGNMTINLLELRSRLAEGFHPRKLSNRT